MDEAAQVAKTLIRAYLDLKYSTYILGATVHPGPSGEIVTFTADGFPVMRFQTLAHYNIMIEEFEGKTVKQLVSAINTSPASLRKFLINKLYQT